MKKSKIFSLFLLGTAVLFATSCSKDDDDAPLGPSLSVTETLSGSTGGTVEITQGATLIFAWESRKGDDNLETFTITQTGANVESPIPVTVEGNEIPYTIAGDDRSNYVDTLEFSFAGTNLGTTNYTFTVKDKSGQSKSVSFNVTVTEALSSTDLSDPIAFTWTREGSNAATGLQQFGLKWTQNSSSSAIVAIDEGTTMVNLGSIAWTQLETRGDLVAAISAGNVITTYQGVSVTANGTYNDVLGVIHDNENYLIHVTNGAVTTGSAGTTITITGQYKN